MATLRRIRRVVEQFIEERRDRYRNIHEDDNHDAFADVTVTEESDHVLVTYDGSGYDYLSIESIVWTPDGNVSGSDETRALLREALPEGCRIEDNNSWSFAIFPD